MKKLLLLILMLTQSFWVLGQDGFLDPSFDTGQLELIQGGISGPVFTNVIQDDGKILVGGDFLRYNNSNRNNIARLNEDGSLDTSFNSTGGGTNNVVLNMALQPDSKIIVVGNFTTYRGASANRIVRLNQDGSMDTSFNSGVGANNSIRIAMIQLDGKIIIGGNFTSYNGTVVNRIARLNADGSLDTSFDPGTGANATVNTMTFQSDGKIIIGGAFNSYNGTAINRIARLNSDGSLDTSFDPGTGANFTVNTVNIQSDGKIITGGAFNSYNGTAINRIARLNSDGSLDSSFDPGTGANSTVNTVTFQSDGKIIIGGAFNSFNGTAVNQIARLNSDGSLDTSFGPALGANVSSVSIQSDDRLIVGISSTNQFYLTRINLDSSFDNVFTFVSGNVNISALEIQSNGKILIGGNFTHVNGVERIGFARLNPDGSLDNSIDLGLNGLPIACCTNILVQSNQKIIFGFGNQSIRLNSDGSVDNSFDLTEIAGSLTSIIQQPDEKIIFSLSNRLKRINHNGSLDTSFDPGTGPNGRVNVISIQADGKIIIGGQFTFFNGVTVNRIARLNSDGSLDESFNPGMGANNTITDIAYQADGKVIIGGQFTSFNGVTVNRIARLNSDGSLDESFEPGSGANNTVSKIIYQSDGKIIITGQFISYNGTSRNRIARLNADGSLDSSFNPGSGANNSINSTVNQSDGNIIIGGIFTSYNGTNRTGIASVLNEIMDLSDTEAPSPDEDILPPFEGECVVNFEDLIVPTATDNVDGKLLGVTDESIFPISEPGNYTITWTFTDQAGNSSNQVQEIILTSGTGILICIDDQIVETEEYSCSYTHLDTSWDVVPSVTCSEGITILSDFSQNLEGWTRRTPSDPNSTVVYMSSGGNPDGFARFNEPGQGQVDYFAAPMKFKGDKSIFYGGIISFDLRSNRSTTNFSNYLLIAGNGVTLQSKAGRINNFWTNYEISLLPSDWFVFGTNTQATETQLKNVLSNINDLSVRADWINGAETVDLDNFQMTALLSVFYELTGATEGTGTSLEGITFHEGETLVTWKQSDGNDSFISCSFTVKVEDKTAPLPDLEELPALFGSCIIELEAPTATDNCSGVITGVTDTPLVLTEPGIYLIDWIFEDGNGNKSTQNQVVKIEDTGIPIITTNGDQNVNADEGRCNAVVPIYAIATDNCEVGEPVGIRSDGESLDAPYPVGVTIITWNVTDVNGNEAEPVEQKVTVVDAELPVIFGEDLTVSADPGLCSALINLEVSATDNCGVGEPSGVRSDGQALDAPYPVGVTTITWDVSDINGNAAETVIQSITITDDEAPIVIAKNAIIEFQAGNSYTLTIDEVDDGSTDNCGIASRTLDRTLFTEEDEGENIVILTIIDASGNENSTEATVTVIVKRDDECVVALTQDIVLVLDRNGTASIRANQVDNGSFTNCSNRIVTRELEKSVFTCADLGEQMVGFRAIDREGNIGETQFKVTVLDETAPRLSNVPRLNITLEPDGVYELPDLRSTVEATDNCAVVEYIQIPEPGTIFDQAGTFTITLMAIDAAGNIGERSGTLNIRQNVNNRLIDDDPDSNDDTIDLSWSNTAENPEFNTPLNQAFMDIQPNTIKVYPNPAYKTTNILVGLSEESNVEISVFDSTGRLVFSEASIEEKSFIRNIPLDGLSYGLYHVIVKINHQYIQGRLVKQ